MSDLKFRAALSDDLGFIVNLVAEDTVAQHSEDTDNPTGPAYLAALAAIDADPNQALYIAEFDGQRVGTFQLSFIPGLTRKGTWRGMIESVHVSPAYRNRGFGREMMVFAIDACRARGCGLVQLTSDTARTDAHRFYERLGFARTHAGFKLKL